MSAESGQVLRLKMLTWTRDKQVTWVVLIRLFFPNFSPPNARLGLDIYEKKNLCELWRGMEFRYQNCSMPDAPDTCICKELAGIGEGKELLNVYESPRKDRHVSMRVFVHACLRGWFP